MATFEEFLNERNITLKRRYTEAYPAKTVGSSAKVRNAIIEALKDGKITVAEFNDIVAQHSSAPAKWTRGNKRFFKIEEDGVSLSRYGQKILTSLVTESVNEKSFDKMVSKSKYDYDNVPSSLDLKDDERNLDEPAEMKNIKKFQKKYGTKTKVTTDNKPIGKRVTVYMEPGVEDGPDEIMEPQLKRHEEMMDFVKKHNLKVSIADTVKGEWTFWTRYGVDESTVTEARYDKKKLLKRLGDADDATIQTGDGKEYIIYNPNSNNKDNAAMWHDKSVFAVDQDGDEHEIDYKDIGLVMTESVNEAKLKFKVGDFIKMKKGGALGYEIKSIDSKFDTVEVYQDVTGQTTNYTIKHINKDWKLAESVNEARVDAKKLLKSVVNGETNSVEGIKLSKGMAQAFSDWLENSTYGRKFSKLPFEKLFTAAFNWGIERYAKSGELKGELKDLKIKAKAMKESKIYESFSEFVINEKSMKDWFLANIDSFKDEKEYMKAGKKAGFSKKELEDAMDDFEQGGEDYLESNEVTEGLNKSDVAYQLAIDYTGRTKPKITKLNKKRIQIKYGYKISPQKVIDSIKTVHPEVELKHVEWSDAMSGGGFHIFDILEANEVTEKRKDRYDFKVGDLIGNTVNGFYYKILKFVGPHKVKVKDILSGREFVAYKSNFELDLSHMQEKSYKLDESFTAKLTGIARTAKNVEDFIKKVFKHEKFKAFDTPKTQKDSYEKFLNFIKSHYAMVKQYESNNIKENMIYTKFTDFVNESLEINEALKSSKLRGLLTMNKANKNLLKAIYGFSKIALDKITDDQIIDIDPKAGKKAEGLVVYYTTQEKKNPYADTSNYNSGVNIPANTILALGMGKDVAYVEGIFNRNARKISYTLTTNPKRSRSDIGINKEYRGWNASGIYNVKRVIDVADAAFVINPNALPDTKGKIEDRIKAKEGAVSFKSDKEFKDANLARYKEILQKRASELPLDKLVADAIDDATNVMKDGLKNQEKNKYGELIAGVGKDGRAYKLNDISNFISKLISDYERWSGYMKTIEDAEAKYGKDSREFQWEAKYAQKEAQEYAKSIKDRLNKLKKRNLAW